MIVKRQKDFNADLGAYLERRKSSDVNSGSFFRRVDSLIPKINSSNQVLPKMNSYQESAVYERDKRPSFLTYLFGMSSRKKTTLPDELEEEVEEIEDELEEIEEEVEELQERKQSILARFYNLLFKSRSYDESQDFEEEIEEDVEFDENELLKQETRATLKIIHKWISRLSPEQIDAFKRSPDFIKYKDILEKYDLIK